MQNEQEFYRCLVSDAAGRTLKKILEIIRVSIPREIAHLNRSN